MSPRATASSVLTAWRASSSSMVSLIEIATGDAGTPFLFRTDWDTDLTFNAFTFSATPTQYGKIEVDGHAEQGGISLKIPDPDGAIAALALQLTTFRDTRVRIWITDLSATGGSGSDGVLSTYFVESVQMEDGSVTLNLRSSFAIFDVALPRGKMTRTEFPGLPTDTPL